MNTRKAQSQQRLLIGFSLLLIMICASCTASMVKAEPVRSATFLPYYAAEVHNASGQARELVLRVTDGQEVVQMHLDAYEAKPLYVHRTKVPCSSALEVSLDGGRTYQRLRGNLCLRNEAGDPQVLYIDGRGGIMLLHVDVD